MSETTAPLRVALNKVLLRQLESAGVRESTLIQVRNDIEGRGNQALAYDQSPLSGSSKPVVNTEKLRLQVMELDTTLARVHQAVLRLRAGGNLGDAENLSAQARDKFSKVQSEVDNLTAINAPITQVVEEDVIVTNGNTRTMIRLPTPPASPDQAVRRVQALEAAEEAAIQEVAIEAAETQVAQAELAAAIAGREATVAEVNALEIARRGQSASRVQMVNGQPVPLVNMPAAAGQQMVMQGPPLVVPPRAGQSGAMLPGLRGPPMTAPSASAQARSVSPMPMGPGLVMQGRPAPTPQQAAMPPPQANLQGQMSQRAQSIGLPTPKQPMSQRTPVTPLQAAQPAPPGLQPGMLTPPNGFKDGPPLAFNPSGGPSLATPLFKTSYDWKDLAGGQIITEPHPPNYDWHDLAPLTVGKESPEREKQPRGKSTSPGPGQRASSDKGQQKPRPWGGLHGQG